MSQKKNEGILFSAEIRVVGSYTDRLLSTHVLCVNLASVIVTKPFYVMYVRTGHI